MKELLLGRIPVLRIKDELQLWHLAPSSRFMADPRSVPDSGPAIVVLPSSVVVTAALRHSMEIVWGRNPSIVFATEAGSISPARSTERPLLKTKALKAFSLVPIVRNSTIDVACAVCVIAAQHIARLAGHSLAPDIYRMFLRAVLLSHSPTTVRAFASDLGMHERTLRKLCESCGAPPPQKLLVHSRLLIYSLLTANAEIRPDEAAGVLGFASTAAIKKQKQRLGRVFPKYGDIQALCTAAVKAIPHSSHVRVKPQTWVHTSD